MEEREEELKSFLLRVKEESEKAGLKHHQINYDETMIMASGPITSWQIEREKLETVTDLFSWAQKSLLTVTAAIKLKDA